jgi:outer membrane protein
MTHRTKRLAALALAPLLAAWCSPALAMDLLQAYRDALAIDPAVASARANLAAIREKVPQARAGLLPSINAAAGGSRIGVDTNTTTRREYNAYNYAVNLTYPLFRLQNVETFEQSKLQVAVGEAALAQAQQDLGVRVSQAYFDVLGAQDNLETIRAQKRAITEQLASAKRNFEVGTATITDQQEAQARFDLTVSQEYAAINDLDVKRALLSQLIGRPVPALKVLRGGVALQPPQPARESDWTENARRDNLAVQQAQVAVEVARRDIDRRRYGHYPTVDFTSSLGVNKSQAFTLVGVKTTTGSIGLQFNLPLYAGGAVEAQVREGIALRDKAQFDLETARRSAEQSARTAFLGVNSGLAQVRALEAAERSSQLALDSNLLGYQVGVRINIDVLNAQQQLYTTRRDLAKARYDVIVNGLKLKFTAAGLSEDDLQTIGALLDTASATPEPPASPAAPAPAMSTPVPAPSVVPGGRR